MIRWWRRFRWAWNQSHYVAVVGDIDPEVLRLGEELLRTKGELQEERRESRMLRERVSYLENRLQDLGPGGLAEVPARRTQGR
jgi:hypothetical protein